MSTGEGSGKNRSCGRSAKLLGQEVKAELVGARKGTEGNRYATWRLLWAFILTTHRREVGCQRELVWPPTVAQR